MCVRCTVRVCKWCMANGITVALYCAAEIPLTFCVIEDVIQMFPGSFAYRILLSQCRLQQALSFRSNVEVHFILSVNIRFDHLQALHICQMDMEILFFFPSYIYLGLFHFNSVLLLYLNRLWRMAVQLALQQFIRSFASKTRRMDERQDDYECVWWCMQRLHETQQNEDVHAPHGWAFLLHFAKSQLNGNCTYGQAISFSPHTHTFQHKTECVALYWRHRKNA